MFLPHSNLVRHASIAAMFIFLALFYSTAIGLESPYYSLVIGVVILFLVWYGRKGRKHARAPATLKDDVSLVIYSSLLALVIVTLRDVRGFIYIEPFKNILIGEIPLEFFRDDPHQSVYEKGEVRKLLYEYVLYFVVNTFLFLRGWRFLCDRLNRKADLSPATALFVFSLFFSTVSLPPYAIDIPHWTPFLSSANEILDGRWPYLHHYSVQYGFANFALLSLWLSLFPLTPLSLAFFMSVMAVVAGVTAYLLIHMLTRSKWLGLVALFILLFSCYDNAVSIHIPNLSAFRIYFPIAAGQLLLWSSISANTVAGKNISALLLGMLILWDPVFGMFMLSAFLAIHLYSRVARARQYGASLWLSLLGGICTPVILIIIHHKPQLNLFSAETYNILMSNHRFFMDGFGAVSQKLHSSEILVFFYLLLVLVLLGRRFVRHRFHLNDRYMFIGGSLIMSVPWVMYELGNSNATYVNPVLWVLAPGIMVVAHLFLRYLRMTRKPLMALVILIILVSPFYHYDFFAPAVAKVRDYTTKYEGERDAWYRRCAVEIKEGRSCDLSKQPGLRFYILEASKPGFGLGVLDSGSGGAADARMFVINLPNYLLADACRRNVPIISIVDGFIYLQNHCHPPHDFPTTLHVSGKGATAGYIRELSRYPVIVYDERLFTAYFMEDHLSQIKKSLEQQGYLERENYGVIHVLARKDFPLDATNCIICLPTRSDEVAIKINSLKWTEETGFPLHKLFIDYPAPRSYSLDVDLSVQDGDGAGVMFRANSAFEYYVFYVNTKRNIFTLGKYRRPDNRNHEDIFNVSMQGKVMTSPDNRYHVRIVADKNNDFQFFVDGVHVAEWMDSEYAGASLGLWYWGRKASFSDFRLTTYRY